MRKTSSLYALFLGLFCFVSAPASSYQPVQNLGESEVRPEASVFKLSSIQTISIDANVWAGKNLSVVDVLSAYGGIQGHKQGGVGSFQSVSIRGAAPRGLKIFIDGVPIEDAGGGSVNLGSIDLSLIERIDVYKGYVPAFLAGNGIGGAIHFITRKKVNAGGQIAMSYGSHGFQEIAFSLSLPIAKSWRLASALAYRHADNDYEFLNRNGTEYNTEDDFAAKRKNAQYTQISGNHSFYKTHESGALSTIVLRHEKELGGNPGKESNQTEVAGFNRDLGQLFYSYEPASFWDMNLALSVSGQIEKSVSHSFYPLDKIGYPNNYFMEYGAIRYFLQPKISLELAPDSSRPWAISLYAAGSAERLEARDNNEWVSAYDWHLSRLSAEGAGNVKWFLGSILAVEIESAVKGFQDKNSGGAWYSPIRNDSIMAKTNAHLFSSARLAFYVGKANSRLNGVASLGRYYREPQLMEQYGVYRNMMPNPDLKEETGWMGELGGSLKSHSEKSKLQISYFQTHQKNGVVWVTNSSLTKPFNLSRGLTRGVEISLESVPTSFFKTRLEATFQKALDRSGELLYSEKELPEEPSKTYYAEATFNLPYHIEWGVRAEYRSRLFKDRANLQRIPPQQLYHSFLSWAPLIHTKLTLSIQNLTDADYQSIYSAFPLPGRSYSLSFTQQIGFNKSHENK